jgi:hypothetical protein
MGVVSDSGAGLQPRYGRIVALAVAASTTLVAVVGALVTGTGGTGGPAAGGSGLSLTAADASPEPGQGAARGPTGSAAEDTAAAAALATAPSTALRASLAVGMPAAGTTGTGTSSAPPSDPATDAPLPASSGSGRRVVFSQSEQRVWLVTADGDVARTYLVSGSVSDNLDPGSYEVYSRSAHATGVDGSELRWMVRFAHGDHAAIGFHWIPRLDGERMQTRAELGTPRSHGCIRQATPDARALWRFAPVGTTVVVTP